MDFEREMQKALRVIFQNIQALDDKKFERTAVKTGNLSASGGKRKQRKLPILSLTALRTSSKSAAAIVVQECAPRN